MNLRELKKEIIKEVPKDYIVKTNFSSCDFMVEIGNLIIIAKPICLEKEVKYEFILDTQFLSTAEITYEEIVIIKRVIELLNNHKKLAISRLKKWTVEDKERRKRQSEEMLEILKRSLMNNINTL